MWSRVVSKATSAMPDGLWSLWSNVGAWPSWNPDVTKAELTGGFGVGSRIAMTLTSGDVIVLSIIDVDEGRRFTDEAILDGITVRTTHEIEAAQGRDTRTVSYRIEVAGRAPESVLAQIGQEVSADFEEVIDRLCSASS